MGTKPIRLRALQCLALWMLLSLAPLCFGEMAPALVVRLLNAKDRHPVPGQLITLHLRFGKAAGAEHDLVFMLPTDSNGEVRFFMPEITPENLEVAVTLKDISLHCPAHVLTRTETVMRDGLIVPARSRGPNSSAIQAAPGEIVLVARPPNLLKKMIDNY